MTSAHARSAAAAVFATGVCLAAAAGAGALLAGPAQAAAHGSRLALQHRLDAVVAAGAPGAIARVDDGHRVWQATSGVADLATQRPIRPRDRVRIASLTKTYVATVALQLVAEQRLSLSDTVERWLPGALPYGDTVTLHQLLNHTGGVPDYLATVLDELYHGDRLRSWEPSQLLALVAGERPTFPAGSGWAYSNTGYLLVGMIIERVTGRPLGRELAQRIFRPLGLRSTTFPQYAAGLGDPHARGYSLERDAQLQPIPGPLGDFTRLNPSPAWASGNIVSTMHDVARFYRALLGGRLLPAALLTAMKTTVATDSPDTRYGLGLFEFASPCGPLYGNDGDIAGYSTRAMASADGTRQIELTINASAAPAAVQAPLDGAIGAAVALAFADAPCARSQPDRGRARHDRGS